MKKITIAAITLLVITVTGIYAQDTSDVWWGTNYMPGNITVGGTLSFESDPWPNDVYLDAGGYAAGFCISPKAEIILYKPVISEISPFDFGVGAKARTGIFFHVLTPTSTSDPWFPLGAAVYGTAHMGFKGFNVHFSDFGDTPTVLFSYLSRLDYYINLGVALDISKEPGSVSGPVGLAAATGFNYFVNDNFFVTTEYTYWHGYSGVAIGGSIKLGKGQKTKTVDIDLNPLYYQMYLGQFYSLYWYSFYAGGFYFDDSNYKEGEGTVWKLTSKKDPEDILIVDKSLLKVNDDGSKWWKVKYDDEGDNIIFEFLIDQDYTLVKLRFRDADTGKIKEYEPSEKDIVKYRQEDMRTVTDSDYSDWNTGAEKISTPAGTFKADHLVYTEDNADYEWWITEKVPGNMVKFFWYDKDDKITGILDRITKNNKSELNTEF